MGGRALKAVFFDLDDTLVITSECDTSAFAAVAAQASQACGARVLDSERFIDDFKSAMMTAPWDPAYPVEAVPVTEYRARIWAAGLVAQGAVDDGAAAAELGAQLQKTFDSVRLAEFEFLDGVPELVARLRARGMAMVVITNGHHEVQRAKLDRCRAEEIFGSENILVGGEELIAGRHAKPHPSIFLRACELVGCEPSEAAMIGDSLLVDVGGALEAGLRAAIWVNAKRRPPKDGIKATAELCQVTELEEKLDALSLI